MSRLRLEPHVKGFSDTRHQVAGAVMDIDLQLRQVLLALRRLPADLVEQGVIDVETGEYRAFARRNEIDVGGLVPDDVLATKVFHQHQHEERIDH